MSLLVSHIYVMARRYRRRRFGRRRRLRRRFRRRGTMLRRRRMLRTHRRGGRRFTVSIQRDFALRLASYVPPQTTLVGNGTNVAGPGGIIGIDPGGFRTYNVLAVPPDLFTRTVGSTTMVGPQWAPGSEYINRRIGTSNGQTAMLTDLPQIVWSKPIPKFFNCNSLWNICEEYRIAWIALSFTVAESQTQNNRHLYIEWTNLPSAKAPQWSDLDGTVVPETYTTVGNLDTAGFNWLCRPIDIAMACSPAGRNSKLNGWHRQMLSYTHPVTIRYRPRHADMTIDNAPDLAPGKESSGTKVVLTDQFSESGRLTRGYLPIGQASVDRQEQCWFGPVIRVVDCNKSTTRAMDEMEFDDFYSEYGIRCTMTAVLRLRAKTCNDPVFPYYTVD